MALPHTEPHIRSLNPSFTQQTPYSPIHALTEISLTNEIHLSLTNSVNYMIVHYLISIFTQQRTLSLINLFLPSLFLLSSYSLFFILPSFPWYKRESFTARVLYDTVV